MNTLAIREELMSVKERPTRNRQKEARIARDFLKAGCRRGGVAAAPRRGPRAIRHHRDPGLEPLSRRRRRCRALWHAFGVRSHVVRRNVPWLTADPVSSINFTPLHELDGIITPKGCASSVTIGRHRLIKEDHRLMINGLVDTPLVFTMEDLMRFPRENHVYFLECAANPAWSGAARSSMAASSPTA
jgi:sulfane dehydrogenase subunit SoxC